MTKKILIKTANRAKRSRNIILVMFQRILPLSKFLLKIKVKRFIDERYILEQAYKKYEDKNRISKIMEFGVREYYLEKGFREFNPNHLFDGDYFKRQLIQHGIFSEKAEENLLKFYIQNFRKIPFTPSPYLDLNYMRNRYFGKIRSKLICIWADYYLNNEDYRLNPNANFDANLYLSRYPDVLNSKMEALRHYILFGKGEGRSAEFSVETKSQELFLYYSRNLFFEKISESKINSKIDYQFVKEKSEITKNESRTTSNVGIDKKSVRILQRKIYFSQNEIKPQLIENNENVIHPALLNVDKDFVDKRLNRMNINNIQQGLFVRLSEEEIKKFDSSDLINVQKIILLSFLKSLHVEFIDKSILEYLTNIDSKIIKILKNNEVKKNLTDGQRYFQQDRNKHLLRYETLDSHTGSLVPNIDHSELSYSVKQAQNPFSILMTTNRPLFRQSILDNLQRQRYKNFEVLIALQPEYSNEDFILMRDFLTNEKIDHKLFKTSHSYPIGSMLNFLSNEAKYELVTKFDDDDLYFENYLKHMNLDMNNLNFDVAGKYPEFIKFENDEFITHDPGIGSRVFARTFNISGSSLTFRKSLLTEISKFPETNKGEDELWRQNIYARGKRILRLPGFDHIVRRYNTGHTWEYEEKEWKNKIIKDSQIRDTLKIQSQDVNLYSN